MLWMWKDRTCKDRLSISKVSQPKSRRDDEPKIKFEKIEFGVATIVYFGKIRKNEKNKTRSTKNQILGLGGWGRY